MRYLLLYGGALVLGGAFSLDTGSVVGVLGVIGSTMVMHGICIFIDSPK